MSNDTPRRRSAATVDTRAREAYITGRPPRIPPMTPEEMGNLGKEAAEMVWNLRAALSLPQTGTLPDFITTMLRHPGLYQTHLGLGLFLFKGAMTVRDRELAILRTGWLLQAPYEWGEHVRHSKKIGITSEEIERVTVGSSAQGWNPHDRAILRMAEELRANAMVSDETWDQLKLQLSDHQLFELLVLIGQFTNVAYFQNSLRLRLEPSNEGLAAR